MANPRREAVAGVRPDEDVSVAGNGDPTVPSGLLVFAVLLATMLGFAGSMVYSAHIGSKLDENALSIATDASPAIEHLSAARGELLRIQLAAVSAVEHFTEGMPVDRAPFANSLSNLHRELTAYLVLPFYPDEHEHYLEVDRAVRDVEAQVSTLLGDLEAGEGRAAVLSLRTGLSPAASRTDKAVEYLVNFTRKSSTVSAWKSPRCAGTPTASGTSWRR